MIGERNLDYLIDYGLDYDTCEDNDQVCGNWIIRREVLLSGASSDIIFVLYRPYPDGSAPVSYPPKATKYRVTLVEEVEGDGAEDAFDRWIEAKEGKH